MITVTLKYNDMAFDFTCSKVADMQIHGQRVTFFNGNEVSGNRFIDLHVFNTMKEEK